MFDLEAAYKFVLSCFDPAMNLVRASPIAERDVYWIFNDNYLASLVLKGISPISDILLQSIAPTDQARIVVLHGRTFPVELQNNIVELQRVGEKAVKTEIPDQNSAPLSVLDYADVAFYSVINKFNAGFVTNALGDLQIAEDHFWNGLWFKDKSHAGLYQVYKGALYLIACNRLSYEGKHRSECETLIDGAQAKSLRSDGNPIQYGGVFTEIMHPAEFTGDVNVETTCLAILARRYCR